MKDKPLTKAQIKAAADRAFGLPSDDAQLSQGGRPSSYDPKYVEQAEKLCLLGATDVEIADFFEIAVSTFYLWKNKYPEFSEALKSGKAAADERVERSLYHKATGYTFESEKIFNHNGEILRAATREHVPPDTTAMIFWLKNRRPEDWRDKSEVHHKHSVESMTDDELARIATGRSEGVVAPKGRPSKPH